MNTSKQKSALSNTNNQWQQFDWKSIEKYVGKLQQRIYRAEKFGQKRKVRDLQRILIHSQSALLLSIKRVTQSNKGWGDMESYFKALNEVNDSYKVLFEHKSHLISDAELEECYHWIGELVDNNCTK